MKRSKGFTLIELLVVVAIIALLVSILLPSLSRAREQAKRAMCSANLNAMGKAFYLYFSENNDRYPMLGNSVSAAAGAQGTATLVTSDDRPFANNNAEKYGTSVQANLFLLNYAKTIGSEKTFCCPSTADAPTDRTPDNVYQYGFSHGGNISYGLQLCYPYPDNNGNPQNKAWLNSRMDGAVAIVADEADTQDRTRPSANHINEGSSVLYHGGYVIFQTRTNDAGWNRNNIYARDLNADGTGASSSSTAVENGNHQNDSIIVHTNDTVAN